MNKIHLLKLLLIRTVLLIALFPALLMISMIIRDIAIEIYGRAFFKYTYIEVIDTPSYKQYTKQYLLEFNSLANNKIISFNVIPNGRPIVIREMADFYENLYPNTLGLAIPGFTSCFILVKKNRPLWEYRETLFHEYLHCMGYSHVSDKDDLMYYATNPIDKEENIRQYAKKVLKKFYE